MPLHVATFDNDVLEFTVPVFGLTHGPEHTRAHFFISRNILGEPKTVVGVFVVLQKLIRRLPGCPRSIVVLIDAGEFAGEIPALEITRLLSANSCFLGDDRDVKENQNGGRNG